MTDLTLHLLLFTGVGAGMVLVPLLIGRLVRPRLPTAEKLSVYECGEPTIGSSYIQFDIRFYVVALLFIIFDVEVVFFFPWAALFGGATQLADNRLSEEARQNLTDKLFNLPPGSTTPESVLSSSDALWLAQVGFVDLLVFFGVLLVGFAYLWSRGDFDWVRAMIKQRSDDASSQPAPAAPPATNLK